MQKYSICLSHHLFNYAIQLFSKIIIEKALFVIKVLLIYYSTNIDDKIL